MKNGPGLRYDRGMLTLRPDECRVLGVLIEKGQTVPGQYPMTLNGLTTGCNQKNNRDPITAFDEDRVMAALDSLRAKKLATEAMLSGSRVSKFRHHARDVFGLDTAGLCIMAELLLRGPQSLGELRQNAGRMAEYASLEVVRDVLKALMERPEPLVKEIPAPAGQRGSRFVQLVCEGLHRLDGPSASPASDEGTAESATSGPLLERIERLEREVAELRERLSRAGV
jgi:uncharacterized protein YceH (UPF0502 family)